MDFAEIGPTTTLSGMLTMSDPKRIQCGLKHALRQSFTIDGTDLFLSMMQTHPVPVLKPVWSHVLALSA